jgi:hypothetical protein
VDTKSDILKALREELERWEALLGTLSEARLTTPRAPSALSIKDEIAHLWAWQRVSIARLEAARDGREPEFPGWPPEFRVDAEDHDVDRINAWIYDLNRERPWSSVYDDWKAGFLRFVALGEAMPEADLMDAQRNPWMRGYSMADVLRSSYEHHHDDHYEPLLAWLKAERQKRT